MVLKFKTLVISASASSSGEDYFAPEKPIILKKILVHEESGTALHDVHIKISVADIPYTKDTIPCYLLDCYYNQAPELNYPVEKGSRIDITITNDTASDVVVRVVLAYEERE